MPLTQLDTGAYAIISTCTAAGILHHYLEGLGLVPGEKILVVTRLGENLILRVKQTQIAINREVAVHLQVEPILKFRPL